jgi:hypothetical protein
VECKEFAALPSDERKIQRRQRVFNGSKFSKAKPGMLLSEK